jgi:hypothetical protein
LAAVVELGLVEKLTEWGIPIPLPLRHVHNFLDDNCVRFCPYPF